MVSFRGRAVPSTVAIHSSSVGSSGVCPTVTIPKVTYRLSGEITGVTGMRPSVTSSSVSCRALSLMLVSMAEDARQYWDTQAATFDEEPDHGLRSPDVRAAWADVLLPALASPPGRVADLGCGTGTIALLLAEAGYDVQGVDLSDAMVAAANAKMAAAGVAADLRQGDAAFPPFEPASFDVVLSRHVLWALDDPEAVLGRWIRLLRPEGRLVLIEGHWPDGSGITAARCRELVGVHRDQATVRLLADPRLWGHRISDERYLLVSQS
ncbi:MAG: SAM-dependent methyltransferase [Amycolatopsis sp.]|nr:SAM-dependent methyltransferase [Amycolatopsis sp.]